MVVGPTHSLSLFSSSSVCFMNFSSSSSSSSSSPSPSLLLLSASASMAINGESVESDHHHHHQHQQKTDPNEPVESFYLSKEEEIDWLNKNAFLERKESTKRKSTSSTTHSTSILSSISLKSKPGTSSIIGLPQTQKSCFTIRKNCKPSKVRFFPKRSKSSSVPPPSEPSSPKVSCIGRVRSKKEKLRSRSLRIHHDQIHHHRSAEEKKPEKKNPKPIKTGFWSNFKAVLRIGRKKPKQEKEEELQSSPPLKKTTEKVGSRSRRTFSDPPVFGELKRFASGRKSESWGGGELSSDDDAAEFDSCSNRGGGGGQCSKNGEANVPPLFGELKRFASGRKS